MASIMDFLLSQGLNVPIGYSMGGQTALQTDTSPRNVDFLPEIDITETKDSLIFECELAGVLKDDISIEIVESKLVIKGDKKIYAYRRPNQSWSYEENQDSNVNVDPSRSRVSETSGESDKCQQSDDPKYEHQKLRQQSRVNIPTQDPNFQLQQQISQSRDQPEAINDRKRDSNEPKLPSQPSDINTTSFQQSNNDMDPSSDNQESSNQPILQDNPNPDWQQQQQQSSSSLDESNVNQPSSLQESHIGEPNINRPSSETVEQKSNVNDPPLQKPQQRLDINEPSSQQSVSNTCEPLDSSVSNTRKLYEEISQSDQPETQQDINSSHKDEKKSSSVSQKAQLFESNKVEQPRQNQPEEKKFDLDFIKSSEPSNVESFQDNNWKRQQEPITEESVREQSNVEQPPENQSNVEQSKDGSQSKQSQISSAQSQQEQGQVQEQGQEQYRERKYVSERTFGHFKRTIDLSKMLYRLNLREVDTHFINGLLIISINKKPFEPSIKIPVH
ncbi:hypothetical protein RB653_008861 [Dictyostelium firmibasis]|uniref:SHSP domain-containing protein n=1 Tax=Dictyostelium firmibasis TaxID=79012 RepID=A0AAN7TRQ6_9MYCE